MMNKLFFSLFSCLAFAGSLVAQEAPFIKLTAPLKPGIAVISSRQFITGSTCKTCTISLNNIPVKVYPTGAFAIELNLSPGDSIINITAKSNNGKSVNKILTYSFTESKSADTVKTLSIATVQTFPEGNLLLAPGDVIQFRVKALPGSRVSTFNNTILYELPVSSTKGMPGIYQGEYTVKPSDDFTAGKLTVTLTTTNGQTTTKETASTFAVMSVLSSDVLRTKGRLAFLEYGLGDDRLGGAKIGYIDSMISLKIIGKVGSHYKVKLAENRTAYIEDGLVTLMPKGSFAGKSLTGRWDVYGDSLYDYINVGLTARLAYQSMQQNDPSKIVVDVFGATNNSNAISQLENIKEIENVSYEQVQDDVFRIAIQLKHKQQWGYQVYYSGTALVIKIRHQPASLSLNNLTIGIDAGHGGSNIGGAGPTGVPEKVLTLAVAMKLKTLLEKEGAKLILTRTTEELVDNKERILLFRDQHPDLLISIHMNSASDPFRAGGTSTLYRYTAFRPLSEAINKRLLQLGLKEYGNIGSFNFMLNSPTEYPNALVETLFISNPEEETLILDDSFQLKVAQQIVAGIKDFLAAAAL